MRLIKFLNESIEDTEMSDSDVANIIKKDCSKFLKESKEYILFRGIKDPIKYNKYIPWRINKSYAFTLYDDQLTTDETKIN
jgi:hypothetical protein